MSPSQLITVEVTTADNITHEYTMQPADELPTGSPSPLGGELQLVEVPPEHRRGRPIKMTLTPEQ
jgi:hypothetical protein